MTRWTRRRLHRRAAWGRDAGQDDAGQDDAGMVTAFVVMFAVALLFVTGLVYDGGRILAAKRAAGNVAESAARAGAQEVDETSLRGEGAVTLDADRARDAACTFLARAGHPCGSGTSIQVAPDVVTVTIDHAVELTLLPLAPQSFTVTGTSCVAYGVGGGGASTVC